MADKKWTSLPEYRIPLQYDSAGAYLRALVQEKVDEMMKSSWSGLACRVQRLEEELEVLCQGFPENILIVNDYVQAARKAGHEVDCQNGSACASEVLHTLGLTRTSPLSKGLRFEEYVNPKFASEWVPSICVRTTAEGRQFVIKYLLDKYGKDYVAVVGCDERTIVMSGKKISDLIPVKASGSCCSYATRSDRRSQMTIPHSGRVSGLRGRAI